MNVHQIGIAILFILYAGLEAQGIIDHNVIEETLSGLGLLGTVLLFWLRSQGRL